MKNSAAPTIVLVEDDDIDAMAIQRAFPRSLPDVSLERAADGLEGLETIRRVSAASEGRLLVLLDLNMPKMSGLELLTELRRDPALAATLAFVLTTSNDSRDLAAAYEHNVAGYIVKSFDGSSTNEVAQLIRSYLALVAFPGIECR